MGTNTFSPDEFAALVGRLRWDKRRHPYHGRDEYQATAHQVLETATALVDAGRAGTVVRTLRTAVDRVTRALMHLDDSSGIVGDALQELTDLYARALEQALPASPKTLASWLVAAQFDGPGWPRIHLRAFAPALGERGITEITAQVQARAATAAPDSWSARFAVRDFREQLAELTGNVDHHIAVLAEDLKSPERYRKIARALLDADRPGEAIDWAGRGLAHHPGNPYSDRLRDLLVDLLIDEGQVVAALEVRVTEFNRHPVAATFRALAATCDRVGDTTPLATALEALRARATENPLRLRELVQALDSVGLDEEAWSTAAAHPGDVGAHLLHSLVERREAAHPAEVLGPYRFLVQAQLAGTGQYRYDRTVKLLRRLRSAHTAAGDPEGFTSYLAELRTEHKRKTSFIAKLDKAGLAP
ncbi:DUF6880 family protein [Kitasatospora aureofaciens]|uniref:DUF6880 family protein n=1 Tax=Kitasatospora aureofaciens TaxID=1894 RepID=UPI0005257966|nr:DUF6880 family protein [Kitasatospora aureofaciens]